ncbi:unnamed protein product [Ilex paraguariensis]|uniref:SHSP domain-containing protein n=1 Tax=Ilex paraguariensis TaxID=185542 RepID=A0ABC8RKI9_9AQUA
MNAEEGKGLSQINPSVTLTGTAKEGAIGPPVGMVDIGISKYAYLFRVALPGARSKQRNIKCDIHLDGTVSIEGEISGSEVLKNSSTVYKMKVQQLCPDGPFTVSFNLPGAVDPRLASPYFRSDGILEVVVMKNRIPGF